MKNQHLLQVIIALIFNFISSGYCDIRETGGKLEALTFQVPENGTMTIGYKRSSCPTCYAWIFHITCPDYYIKLWVNFGNGRTQYIKSQVRCGMSSWSTIITQQKGITIDGQFHDVRSYGSKYPLNGATLTVSCDIVVEVKVIDINHPEPPQITTSTPAPTQNTQVILGVAGGCVGILILAVIITIGVLWYMRKRQSQEEDQDQECEDYADVTNIDDAIYMDVVSRNHADVTNIDDDIYMDVAGKNKASEIYYEN